jgi:hypothetical protein
MGTHPDATCSVRWLYEQVCRKVGAERRESARVLERNQSPCGPVSFVQGRHSLVVASTLVLSIRDTPTLFSL